MLKNLFEYVVGLSQKELMEVDGQVFATGDMHLLENPTADTLTINTLSGLVEYIQSDLDSVEEYSQLLIQVVSPTIVKLYSELNNNKKRDLLVQAVAKVPDFAFDRFHDAESFNIKMQSCFVNEGDRAIVLQVVGNIKSDEVKTYGDDGVTQTVTAKTGVASVENVIVPNPVSLQPFRTFQQVDQPSSNFVFRMKEGPSAALYEADGGAWETEAMKNIADYLKDKLEEELSANEIYIIA